MATSYPWREQEQHYQPWRLKVVERQHYNWRHNLTAWGYSLAIFNEVTHEIEYLTKDGEFKPEDEIESDHLRVLHRQEDAIELAKRVAIDNDLPYIISKDYGTYLDLHKGPVLRCLVCGKSWKHRGRWARGWEADVCPECRDAVAAHNARQEDLETYRIGHKVIAHPGSWHSYHDVDDEAFYAMIGIATPLGEIKQQEAYGRSDVVIGAQSGAYRYNVWSAPMRPWQLEALRKTIKCVNRTVRVAYQEGVRKGSNLIEKLRSGEMHPDDFSDIRRAKD